MNRCKRLKAWEKIRFENHQMETSVYKQKCQIIYAIFTVIMNDLSTLDEVGYYQ